MNHRVLLQKQQDSQLLNSLQLQVNEMQAALEDDKMRNKQTIQHNQERLVDLRRACEVTQNACVKYGAIISANERELELAIRQISRRNYSPKNQIEEKRLIAPNSRRTFINQDLPMTPNTEERTAMSSSRRVSKINYQPPLQSSRNNKIPGLQKGGSMRSSIESLGAH